MKLNLLMVAVALGAAPAIVNAAAYSVQELPVTSLSANQFGSSIDNSGLILTTLTNPFNPPIDMSLFDVANFPSLSDPDAAAQGNFNTSDYTLVVNAFRNNAVSFSTFGQKLASRVIYQTDGTDAQYVFGFDQEQDNTNGFTFALNSNVAGSANGAYIAGNSTSLFRPVDFVTDAGDEFTAVIADFFQRGFVQFDGNTTPLLPIDTTLEGRSQANAINENLQVAGASSVGVRDAITTGIETCNSEENTFPLDICLYELKTRVQEQFIRRATVWQLDAQGEVISSEFYPLSFTPEADDTRNFVNDALDINNAGVAVGSGTVLRNNVGVSAAMVYENGTTTRLIEDDDMLPNFAIGINDAGIVAGYQIQAINNQGRAKLFTYDLNSGELVFPDDFFVSSSTIPRDINNNGIVVGDGEIEASQSQRRRAAFMYDMQSGEFVNLNDLIACDSPYDIVSANSINDSNEIVADATVFRSQKNVRGEALLDADGNEIFETAVVALKLTPTGQEAPDCSVPDAENPDLERQGASTNTLIIIALLGLAVFRRKRFSKNR
ncbi:DUF3466 family protein [Glaciecola siphonariae]|uniref:DUF3466 family protein n=1 Tax=Glaciecola siphonariae TaxID=521012 RepID=A0ABV9LSL1_9ALTE